MQTNPSADNTAPNSAAGINASTGDAARPSAVNKDASPDAPRNFSTISPSAYSLLLMKGLTAIPYARQAAELLIAPQPYNPDVDGRQPLFWARLMHFENRYWSINQLMTELPITNILEISSGFSFRGLALSHQQPVFYIDTDLPELIATKQQFVTALTAANNTAVNMPAEPIPDASTDAAANNTDANSSSTPPPAPGGHYELAPLNALDTAAFDAIIDRFPPGPILILNEGLLVYLDETEKTQLCHNIHNTLQRRGGYWITADVYIQKDIDPSLIDRQDQFSQFLQQHNIEEKKFRDFESANDFFINRGFIVDREARTDVTKLSSWPHLLRTINPETQKKLFHSPRMHATWRLKIAD